VSVYEVYLFDQRAGVLTSDRGRLSFQYDPAALPDASLLPISVRLPKQEAPYPDETARPFFENLLPEDEYRRLAGAAVRTARENTAGLLGAIGGECAGAVSIWPAGAAPPTPPAYRRLTPEEFRDAFAAPSEDGLLALQREGRLSLAGAQPKLTLRSQDDGWALGVAGAPTTHILKRTRLGFSHLVENEYYCMRLARAVRLPVPDAAIVDAGIPVLAVERFDRTAGADNVERLHQEDFCQMTGTLPQHKYEADGGPGLATCAEVIRRHSALPVADLHALLQWVVFNYLMGNEDAHAKNLAMLYIDAGLRLAPFYDIVSTAVYKGLSRKAAMAIGGERRYAYVKRRHWERMAQALEIKMNTVAATARGMAHRLERAWPDVSAGLGGETASLPIVKTIGQQTIERITMLRGELDHA
jgi:serine/threonine-protein kinase HipA